MSGRVPRNRIGGLRRRNIRSKGRSTPTQVRRRGYMGHPFLHWWLSWAGNHGNVARYNLQSTPHSPRSTAGYQCCLSRWAVRVQPRAHTSARWTPLPRVALTSHPESAILHEGDSDVWTRPSTDAANARATDAANANDANAAATGAAGIRAARGVPWCF